jgi:hypothetical protein
MIQQIIAGGKIMPLTKQSVIAFMLAFFLVASFSAQAALGLPLLGKKKKADQDILPTRKLTASQNALIDKAVAREKEVVKTVKERAPLVETYIQNMRPDPALGQVPESDQHFLGRVEFGKIIGGDTYAVNKATSQGATDSGKFGFFKHSASFISGLSSSLHLTFNEGGFVQMLLMDSNDFDRQHYAFGYVRNEFLGTTPTAVFDVTPSSVKHATGRFLGRIWIETRNGNVVRFNGNFAGTEEDRREYYHFDSWRTNVQPEPLAPYLLLRRKERPEERLTHLEIQGDQPYLGLCSEGPAKRIRGHLP